MDLQHYHLVPETIQIQSLIIEPQPRRLLTTTDFTAHKLIFLTMSNSPVDPMDKLNPTNKLFIFLLPIGISMSSFVMGYFIVYFTMMEEYIQQYHRYTNEETQLYFTLTSTLLPAGAFIATFFYTSLVDRYGENKVLKYMDAIAVVAIVMQVVTIHTASLCVSRIMMGFFCGITSGLVPSYIVSMSPSFTSGILGSYNQIAMAIGMSFAYYMGQFLDNNQFSEQAALKIFISIPLVCLFVHLVLLFLFPFDTLERHFLKRQNLKVRGYLKMVYGPNWKAFESQIREHKIIPVEIEPSNKSTRDVYEQENFQEKKTLCKCKKISFIIIGIMLAAGNQLSGIDAILQYAKQLFLVIENGDQANADMSVMILGFFQVICTIIGGILVNKFGRRPLMLIGMTIIFLSLFTGAMVAYFVEDHESITVFVVFTHVLGFSVSLGPITMLYAVEALEDLKPVIISYWALNLIITLTSDFLIESVGISIMFAIFAVCTLLCLLFFSRYLVQTKGTPRKRVWQAIEGIKSEWEKSALVFSISTANKTDDQVEKSQGTI